MKLHENHGDLGGLGGSKAEQCLSVCSVYSVVKQTRSMPPKKTPCSLCLCERKNLKSQISNP
jgi:hypothetical protein